MSVSDDFENDKYGRATRPDEFGICWEPAAESPQPFAEKVKEYCEMGASDADYINLFASALQGEYDFGSIAHIVFDKYVVAKVSEKAKFERARLKEQMTRKLEKEEARLRKEFDQRLEREVELRGIYNVIRDKFLNDPEFLNQALRQIKDDVRRSKELGEYPHLYEMTVHRCNRDELVEFLVKEHSEDLIARFGDHIKERLLESRQAIILDSIKEDLRQNEVVMAELRCELKKDMLKEMFQQ